MAGGNRRKERGAAMAEFAFVVPVLVILLFSIVQLGIAYNRTQALHAAAREGARHASITGSDYTSTEARVQTALVGVNFPTTPVVPGFTDCAGRSGQEVTVQVNATYDMVIPLVNTWTLNLSGQGVFRCE